MEKLSPRGGRRPAAIDADLALGRHPDLVGELSVLATADQGRQLLADDYGLDPGAEPATIRQAILTDDPELLVPERVSPDKGVASSSTAVVVSARPVGRFVATGPPLNPRPAQLPAPPRCFVGRVEEPDWLRTALSPMAAFRNGSPVLLGPPGSGKTALGLRVAAELAPAYPDGQLYLDLRGRDARPADPDALLPHGLRPPPSRTWTR